MYRHIHVTSSISSLGTPFNILTHHSRTSHHRDSAVQARKGRTFPKYPAGTQRSITWNTRARHHAYSQVYAEPQFQKNIRERPSTFNQSSDLKQFISLYLGERNNMLIQPKVTSTTTSDDAVTDVDTYILSFTQLIPRVFVLRAGAKLHHSSQEIWEVILDLGVLPIHHTQYAAVTTGDDSRSPPRRKTGAC